MAGCKRGGAETKGAFPSTSASASVGAETTTPMPGAVPAAGHEPGHTPLPLVEGTSLPSPHLEARRGLTTQAPYKTLLVQSAPELKTQFGEAATTPLQVQEAQLENARRAVLIAPPAKDAGNAPPLLLVLDERGTVLWTKPRPFAGTRKGIVHYTVTAHARGGVAVAWHDTASHVAALRMWDSEGMILADFQLLEVELCDTLSAAYWPGVGHLVTVGKEGTTQIQLLGSNGALQLGREGRVLSAVPWGAPGATRPSPVSLVVETGGATAFFYASAKSGPGDDVRAVRFDAQGGMVWKEPLIVGDVSVPRGAPVPDIDVAWTDEGQTTVRLGPKRLVDVTAEGTVLLRK